MKMIGPTDAALSWCCWIALSGTLCCTPLASERDTYGGAAAESGEGAPAAGGGPSSGRPPPDTSLPPPPYPNTDEMLPSVGVGGATATLDASAPAFDAGSEPAAPSADAGPPDAPPPVPCAGTAFSLDGATFAQLPNPVQDDFTLEAWIKTTESLDGTRYFQGRSIIDGDVVGGGDLNDFAVGVLNGSVTFGHGNPETTLQGTSTVITGEWVHVAATRRASTGELAIIVNGTVEALGTSLNRNPLTDPETLAIGGSTIVRNFVGLIDEVRIWSVVRTPEEIRASLHEVTSADEPGLVAYYRFEDRGSAVARDSSLQNSGATLVGAPAYLPPGALCETRGAGAVAPAP